jgi:hypothetical protein
VERPLAGRAVDGSVQRDQIQPAPPVRPAVRDEEESA